MAEPGFMGTYKGPKPKAYSKLSPAEKRKEDARNEREEKSSKKSGKKGAKRARK